MTEQESFLKGIHILAVDDEEDVLETIVEILDESRVDTAREYQGASEKIKKRKYDLAILDIMGVDGLKLLEETVARGIPTVMLTAHAISPETLMESIKKVPSPICPKRHWRIWIICSMTCSGLTKEGSRPGSFCLTNSVTFSINALVLPGKKKIRNSGLNSAAPTGSEKGFKSASNTTRKSSIKASEPVSGR